MSCFQKRSQTNPSDRHEKNIKRASWLNSPWSGGCFYAHTRTQCSTQLLASSHSREKTEKVEVFLRGGVLFTCGVCRQALLIASELECRVVYLGSGKEGCIAKCGCLLFMDIILASFSN